MPAPTTTYFARSGTSTLIASTTTVLHRAVEAYPIELLAVTVVLTGSDLTIDEVVRVAREGEQVELAPSALERMRAARAVVDEVVDRGDEIYGFTTGVGMRKQFAVEGEMASFNRMLVRGHLIGQGPDAPEEVVRAMLTGLANGLAQGAPGSDPGSPSSWSARSTRV